ncbi:MAG: TonB-dependent receptor [Pseudoxanthomonas sp.]
MPHPNRSLRIRATARAISLALGMGLAAAGTTPVWAQSNATATIYGEVPTGSGASVVLQNVDTGVQRSIIPDATGRYRATSLPPGRYQVRLMHGDTVDGTTEVVAKVGIGVEARFGRETQLEAVQVLGTAHGIDVTSTNNGVVFTGDDLLALPVANDVASAIQLTPGAVRGTNNQYGNAPSLGGSSQSENSFYVNGFPITNILTQVGTSELPFGSISNMQVLVGGYGAEFGRSTGGVVNITTRSGGNDFKFGGKLSWSPNSLRGNPSNIYFPDTGVNPDTDGALLYHNRGNRTDSKLYALYASGPIVKDKLFFYIAAEQTRTDSQSVAASTQSVDADGYSPTGWSKNESKVDRYLAKIDYNLTDDHHFEFTKIYDRTQSEGQAFGYDYDGFHHDGVPGNRVTRYVNCCGGGSAPGADVDIFKYTGYLTDDLTVTALYGNSETTHRRYPQGYDPSMAQTSSSVSTRVPGLTYNNAQTVTGNLIHPDSGDKQKGGRLDVEYRLGRHSLRGGIDRMDVDSVVGSELAGGYRWTYRRDADPNRLLPGATETIAQGGGYGTQGYYVSQDINTTLARPSSKQSAQYLQDRWQVTDNFLLDLGLRREQFTNYTTDGAAFIEQDDMIAPRLGASWDFFGDGSLKLFANAGRYHLPVPSNLSSNLASPLLSTSQYFTYTGVDAATGAPIGTHAISPAYSANNFYGTARNAHEITAIDLKPLSQDEITLGFEKQVWSNAILGANLLYRRMNETNDDTCDQRPIDAWAARNDVDTSNFGFSCAIINPGSDNDLWVDFADGGGLRRVDISAEEWGIPKARRNYKALNVFLEHPYGDGWYGRIDYTLSYLHGNMEGQVDTLGGGDVALTVSSDHGELMYNATGYLPADRRHALKAYGYVEVLPSLTLGGNFTLMSGAPRNCLGELPAELHDGTAGSYGSAYFYCDGEASPRGSQGRSPWLRQLDVNAIWQPAFAKGLSFKVDVFNLFDKRAPLRYDSVRDSHDYESGVSQTYGQILSRQSPRSVRLTMEYNWD